MIDEEIVELVEAVKNIAPEVWRILVRQAYVDGVYKAVWFVIGVVGLFFIKPTVVRAAGYMKKADEADEADELEPMILAALNVAVFVFLIIVALNSIVVADDVVNALVNPEFYAIKILIEQIKP